MRSQRNASPQPTTPTPPTRVRSRLPPKASLIHLTGLTFANHVCRPPPHKRSAADDHASASVNSPTAGSPLRANATAPALPFVM